MIPKEYLKKYLIFMKTEIGISKLKNNEEVTGYIDSNLSSIWKEKKSNEEILSEMITSQTLYKLFNGYIKKHCFDRYHSYYLMQYIIFELYETDDEEEEKVKYNLNKKIYDGIFKIDKEDNFWKEFDQLSKNKFEIKSCVDIEYLSEQISYYLFCLFFDDKYKFQIKEIIQGLTSYRIKNENDEEKILKFNEDYFENFDDSKTREYNINIQNETNKKLTKKLKEIIHMISFEEIINELITKESEVKFVDDSRVRGCIIN